MLKDKNAFIHFAEELGFGDIHFKIDEATGLRAIIAIHSTKNGPALGGCRCIEYPTSADAINDVLRLAQAMSYKAAVNNLPHGGGKAVIIKPKSIRNRQAYFEAFGRFVNELGGRYITAVDSGTTTIDMDHIAKTTSYVASSSNLNGDPSPYTAQGVVQGIYAAVKYKLGKSDLKGLHIAIQGIGNVGYLVAQALFQAGTTLTISDVSAELTERCAKEFKATIVKPQRIHAVDCDVLVPCALGGIINVNTISEIKASVIAGSANNQLASATEGDLLQQKGILYAPDYVINAGGLIYAAMCYAQGEGNVNPDGIAKSIKEIYNTLITIFERSNQEQQPTNVIADLIAAERL